jgi:hypothetical protein
VFNDFFCPFFGPTPQRHARRNHQSDVLQLYAVSGNTAAQLDACSEFTFFFSFERVLVFTEIMHALYSFTKIPHMHALPLIYATPISWRFCQCDGSRDSDSS